MLQLSPLLLLLLMLLYINTETSTTAEINTNDFLPLRRLWRVLKLLKHLNVNQTVILLRNKSQQYLFVCQVSASFWLTSSLTLCPFTNFRWVSTKLRYYEQVHGGTVMNIHEVQPRTLWLVELRTWSPSPTGWGCVCVCVAVKYYGDVMRKRSEKLFYKKHLWM